MMKKIELIEIADFNTETLLKEPITGAVNTAGDWVLKWDSFCVDDMELTYVRDMSPLSRDDYD